MASVVVKSLPSELTKAVIHKGNSSAKAHKELWKASIEEISMEEIEKLHDAMDNFVEKHVLDRVELDLEPRELTVPELQLMAAEYVKAKAIQNYIESRREQLRTLIFDSLDTQFAREGKDDSETPFSQMPGHIEIDGVKFCREGGTRKAATLNLDALAAAHPDLAEELVVEKVEVKRELNEEALNKAIAEGRISLEDLRPLVTPGDWQTPRFQVR